MIQLYNYQSEIITRTREYLAAGKKRILIQSPTGSGKTVIFSYIVSEMKKRGKRALIITDRVELLFETGGTLEQFGLRPYHILAGQMAEPPAQYQVCVAMSQTLRRRIGKWKKFFSGFDVVVMDECHKQEFNPYFEAAEGGTVSGVQSGASGLISGAFPPSTIILGFSATPLRSGKQRQLADDYEVLIDGLQVPELIKRGKLVPDHYYGTIHADMSGVRLNTFGDYQESGMFERFNRRELYAGVVENWSNICPETLTLCFCVNIRHAVETCKSFNEAGVPAKFLVSDVALPVQGNGPDGAIRYEKKMDDFRFWKENYAKYSGERRIVLKEWGKSYQVLVNAGILTTGFNRPGIETIIVNRATLSLPLWLQMLGRGSRTFPGKSYFNILDFGDNAKVHGYYNQEREWSLIHDESKGGEAMPVKECGKMASRPKTDSKGNNGCGAYVFVSKDICPYCGYIFEQEKEMKFADLVKIDYLNTPLIVNDDYFLKLEREAEQRGYKHGWVIARIISKGGAELLKEYATTKGYKNGWYWATRQRYSALIEKWDAEHGTDLGGVSVAGTGTGSEMSGITGSGPETGINKLAI